MQGVLSFPNAAPTASRRPRPTKACSSCRNRRVKCDCVHPVCSECSKRNLICEYQGDASSDEPVQPKKLSTQRYPESGHELEGTEGNLNSNNYSCQFAGDTLSILADTDETTNEDVKILRNFDRQMSQLSLSANANHELIGIMQSLPPHEECWRLYQAFKLRVHPVVPIIHLPTLESLILEFWNDFPFTMHGDTLALLLAVTYCGLISLGDDQYPDLSDSLYSSYEKLIQSYDFPTDFSKSTLPRLQSYVLVGTCRASQTEPIASFGFLPSTVRIAQALKLHIESKSENPIDLEIRRRLWWHLIYLDVEASLPSGLPNLIHSDDYTTEMPSEIRDDAIGEVSVHHKENIKSPMMIAMNSRYHWALQMRKWRKRPPKDDELQRFEKKINDLQFSIPDTTHNNGPRVYVSLQIDRAVCSSPRQILRGEKPIGNTSCDHQLLKSARFFLAKFVVLSLTFAESGLQWFIPGLIQPLQPMMILLLHLTTCDAIDYEDALGTKQLLDRNFELVGNRTSQGRVVSSLAKTEKSRGRSEKANLIYCLLAKIRTRTYERAGWHLQHDEQNSGCPIRNLSEAIEMANAHFKTGTVPVERASGVRTPSEAGKMPPVRMDIADYEEWDGFFEEFLETGMIE